MRPLLASQTRTLLSLPVLTIHLPSGLNLALFTEPALPCRMAITAPLLASHTRAVLSSLAVTIHLPSGPKVALVTSPV